MRRVLVIEWGERIAAVLRATLAPQGWVVDLAADGVAAMDLLAGGVFDLIVIDLRLPGEGALEVVRMLHEHDVLAAVLLLAGQEDVCAAFSGVGGEPCSLAR